MGRKKARSLLLLTLLHAGCDGKPADVAAAPPMYYRDVAPIIKSNCLGCHVKGGIAPFALDTPASVQAHGASIAVQTRERIMPPYNADAGGDCQTFTDARYLTGKQIDTLDKWVKSGKLLGNASDDTSTTPKTMQLQGNIVTLDPGASYTPGTSRDDDYRCYVLDPGQDSDMYLTGYAVKPGSEKTVHHMLLYAATSTTASAQAEQLDANSNGTGYTCFGGIGINQTLLAGWAPGKKVTQYPQGTGIRLQAGVKLVMQIHYNVMNGAEPDRTTVDLALEPVIAREAIIGNIFSPGLNLAPGQISATATAFLDLGILPRQGIDVYGVFPHMHRRGTKLSVEIQDGDEKTCLLNVNRWDFNWQEFFMYQTPVHIKRDQGRVKLTCTYDTTQDKVPVRWGESTEDEMCLNYFYYTR